MAEEKKIKIEDKPRSRFSKAWHRIDGKVWFLVIINILVFAIITFFYNADVNLVQYQNMSTQSIQEIDNLAEVPEGLEAVATYGTFIDNGETGYIKYYDDEGDIYKAPYSSFPGVGFFIMFVINVIMLFAFAQDEEDGEGIKGQQEVNIVKEFLDTKKIKEKANWIYEFSEIEDRKLVHKLIGEKLTPLYWVIPVTFMIGEGHSYPVYRIIRVYYKTGDLIEVVTTDSEFGHKDTCPDCGKFCDFKVETTEDLKQTMDLMKGLSKR